MNYEQSNVGPGMVPCKKNCRCNDCTIERLQARARIAEQREAELVEALRIAWRDSDIRCAVSGGRVEAVLAKHEQEKDEVSRSSAKADEQEVK